MIGKIITLGLLAVVFMGVGAYYATSGPTNGPEQPWKAQVVIDATKIDGHLNVGVGWRRVSDEVRSSPDEIQSGPAEFSTKYRTKTAIRRKSP